MSEVQLQGLLDRTTAVKFHFDSLIGELGSFFLLISGLHKCPAYLFRAWGYEFCFFQIYFYCFVLMSLIEVVSEERLFSIFFTQ